jgi:hypothetical protein
MPYFLIDRHNWTFGDDKIPPGDYDDGASDPEQVITDYLINEHPDYDVTETDEDDWHFAVYEVVPRTGDVGTHLELVGRYKVEER